MDIEAPWFILIFALSILLSQFIALSFAARGLRFTIRHLLIVTAMASLLLAALGIFLRSFAE